ncbi:hypothetical protein BGX31_000440, partial [Mortierella sp. GBA43]
MARTGRKWSLVLTGTWLAVLLWILTIANVTDARRHSEKSLRKHEHFKSSKHAHHHGDAAHHSSGTHKSQDRKRGQAKPKHHVNKSKTRSKTSKATAKTNTNPKGNSKGRTRVKKGHPRAEESSMAPPPPQQQQQQPTHHTPTVADRRGFVAMDVDMLCGPGPSAKCPPEKPCCSQWGYCGIGPEYCQSGCQLAYGKCGDSVETTAAATGPAEASDVDTTTTKRRRPRPPAAGGASPSPSRVPRPRHPNKKIPTPPPAAASPQGAYLQERRRRYPDYDGRLYRIPSTVTKLPSPGTLVNIGYFPGWMQYRGLGRINCHQRPYLPASIPWASLDYVMFAFVYFDDDYRLYPADTSDEPLYFEIQRQKLATGTRVLISVGGWSFTHPEGGGGGGGGGTRHRFERMIQSKASRKTFIESCIEFCQFFGFDGVDIDYEYPSYQDRASMTALFKEMRDAFDTEGSGLVLSLAGASFQEGVQGYELDKVAEYVDFIMIMAYDLYGAYDSNRIVNIHTALIQTPTESHRGHSVQGAVELYLDQGVPRQKLVLGLALYGKSFILTDPWNSRQPGVAKFSAGGDPTGCIEARGDIAYNEIANLVMRQQLEQQSQQQSPQPSPPTVRPQWDPNGRAFYFVYGDRQDNWVGYDDRPSLDLKLQLVTEQDLAGVMWWSLDQDLDATSDE